MAKSSLTSYLQESLILVQKAFSSKEELFKQITKIALEKDFIREDFLERIEDREKKFPTGIQLATCGVAIPHTDAECILNEFIAIVTLRDAIEFYSMEDNEQSIQVKIVFVLGLNQPHAQLDMLQSLVALLQNEQFLTNLCLADSKNELLENIKKMDL